MTFTPTRFLFTIVLPVLLASGCGGGGTSSTTDQSPDLGAGEVDSSVDVTTAITGRVADGYLQGATVCVDLNSNSRCDDDEPSVVTGVGGAYSLEVSEADLDKPVIADVPESAIDEDTGLPIGKKLVLSTLADRAEFISPLTTLIVEEKNNNPDLSVEEAAEKVKDALGFSGEEDADLFTDYVKGQKENDQGKARKYRHMHQTARVVADMMDNIQERVEVAAVEEGIDIESDDATRAAIQQFVRQEIRELLPEISLSVAEAIVSSESETDLADVSLIEELDPEKVADKLLTDDLDTDLIEKIESIRDYQHAERADMESLLTDGMYWIDVDCDAYYMESEDSFAEKQEAVEVQFDDEGTPNPTEYPSFAEIEDCHAEYGYVSVSGDENIFTQKQYEFDAETGAWVELEDEPEERTHALILVDGEWSGVKGDSPSGPVDFPGDGSALLSTDHGAIKVTASERVLTDTAIERYLDVKNQTMRIADGKVDEFGEPELNLFPEGSSTYLLNIERQHEAYLLFTWFDDESDDNGDSCVLYADNCNVVDSVTSDGFDPLVNLNQIREGALYGMTIAGMVYSHFEDKPIDVTFSAEPGADQGLPTYGTVSWTIPVDYTGEHGIEPAPTDNGPVKDQCPDEAIPHTPDPTQTRINELPTEHPQQQCPSAPVDPLTAKIDETDKETHEYEPGFVDQRGLGNGKWKVVEVDGIEMIEFEIPVAVRHNSDIEDAHRALLIEHDGYVRRGAHIGSSGVDQQRTYSEVAFESLLPYAEAKASE